MHGGVGLDLEQLGHLDRPGNRDPADIVAQKVHDHQVFGHGSYRRTTGSRGVFARLSEVSSLRMAGCPSSAGSSISAGGHRCERTISGERESRSGRPVLL